MKKPPASSSLAVDDHSMGRQNMWARRAYEICQDTPPKKTTARIQVSHGHYLLDRDLNLTTYRRRASTWTPLARPKGTFCHLIDVYTTQRQSDWQWRRWKVYHKAYPNWEDSCDPSRLQSNLSGSNSQWTEEEMRRWHSRFRYIRELWTSPTPSYSTRENDGKVRWRGHGISIGTQGGRSGHALVLNRNRLRVIRRTSSEQPYAYFSHRNNSSKAVSDTPSLNSPLSTRS